MPLSDVTNIVQLEMFTIIRADFFHGRKLSPHSVRRMLGESQKRVSVSEISKTHRTEIAHSLKELIRLCARAVEFSKAHRSHRSIHGKDRHHMAASSMSRVGPLGKGNVPVQATELRASSGIESLIACNRFTGVHLVSCVNALRSASISAAARATK